MDEMRRVFVIKKGNLQVIFSDFPPQVQRIGNILPRGRYVSVGQIFSAGPLIIHLFSSQALELLDFRAGFRIIILPLVGIFCSPFLSYCRPIL